MASDEDVFDQLVLHDVKGEKLLTYNAVPPFEQPPEIVVVAARYFMLYDDGTYHEAERVHWLPTPKEWKHADP